jgi:hypothetical protein
MYSKMKYSDIVKTTEVPIQCLQAISIAREFGLILKPGRKIKADGNCMIRWTMDQLTRYGYRDIFRRGGMGGELQGK